MDIQICNTLRWIALPIVVTVLGGCLEMSDPVVDVAASPGPIETTNTPPTISGVAATSVQMGANYSFTPSASDIDGDTLEFQIQAKPIWADFDSSNGNLSGVPLLADVGTHRDIVISVSDGTESVGLPAFAIVVNSDSTPPIPNQNYIGFGAVTQGADSCPAAMETYRVTSLSGGGGAGTFRDAVSVDCRHIVFDVAGDIDLGDLQISNSYLTIDGATAPAPGITLVNVGRLAIEASGGREVHDIVVNNIRAIGRGGSVEGNDLWELDGSSGAPIFNIVLDHLTMDSSGDGNVDIYGNVHDITLSNSLIANSIQGHHFSMSTGLRERITIYGNVYARINERQPRIRYDTRQLDFIGNVIYGWGWFEGGASGMHLDIAQGTPSANVENNIYHYVSGLSGSTDDALVIESIAGAWFFTNNTWPSGEATGEGAANANRISMTFQGIDFAAPRQGADILAAGTGFKTQEEQQMLEIINNDIAAGGSGEPGGGGGGGGGSGGGYVPPEFPSVYEGIPDVSVEFGFDVWGDFPVNQTISGSRGQESLSCNGTAANPCVIDASGATFSAVSLSGSFVILQGGLVNAPAGNGPWVDTGGCTNCVIRDMELAGPGIDSGHSAAVGLGSRNAWLRGSVHGFGDNRVNAREQDFHGFKVQATDVWILEAEIYDVSGDSVQVGDASRGSGERVYMGGGYYHHNRENAVDIKDSRDVVVSGVLMEGFRPTSSSPGEALIIHDDAFDARIFNNIIRDSTMGMVSSGKDGHIIQNNNIEAINVGIQLRATTNITVTGNIIDAPVPIEVQGGVTGTVQGN